MQRQVNNMKNTGAQTVEFDEIAYEINGAVAEIVLNRPAQLNPISGRPGGTREQIMHALDLAEADPAIGCVIVRGAGRAFSAGGELSGGIKRETATEHLAFLEHAERFHSRIRTAKLPVIGAVHGLCLGAAMTLAASCDFVIAAESARFGLPEGRIGLIGVTSIVSRVDRQWAKFLMITGEMISARKAAEIGLVLTVEPDEVHLDRTRELAVRISRLPKEAILLNRRTIDAFADAAGESAGRIAGTAHDIATLVDSMRAAAPDGRTFREILATDGMDGMKKARAEQYDSSWLTP